MPLKLQAWFDIPVRTVLLGEQCCRERIMTFKLSVTIRRLIKIKRGKD